MAFDNIAELEMTEHLSVPLLCSMGDIIMVKGIAFPRTERPFFVFWDKG